MDTEYCQKGTDGGLIDDRHRGLIRFTSSSASAARSPVRDRFVSTKPDHIFESLTRLFGPTQLGKHTHRSAFGVDAIYAIVAHAKLMDLDTFWC